MLLVNAFAHRWTGIAYDLHDFGFAMTLADSSSPEELQLAA